MTHKRQAAAHNRAHNGTARIVREVLATATEPLSCDRIAQITGLKPAKVKISLSQMITVSGGIVASRGRNGIVYSLYRVPERTGTVAGRITIPGYNWRGTRQG